MKIEHTAYNVPEALKMADWYSQNLGLTIVRSVGDPNQTVFLADDSGTSMIEFYTNPLYDIPDYASINPFVLHIAYVTPDIDAERERLVAAGATVFAEVMTSPAGDQLQFLRDPWGFAIQLAKRVTPMIKNS